MRAATRGVDTLVYLVGVPYNHFELHPVLMRKTLDGAIAEGVERVVLIGTVYPYGLPVTTPVTESHPRNPQTFKGLMRKEHEEVLLKAPMAGHSMLSLAGIDLGREKRITMTRNLTILKSFADQWPTTNRRTADASMQSSAHHAEVERRPLNRTRSFARPDRTLSVDDRVKRLVEQYLSCSWMDFF